MTEEFDTYLAQRGLLPRTRRAYIRVVSRAGEDPVQWLRELVAKRVPVGTVQQARAAVAHYLRWQGKPEAEIKAELPPGRGRQAVTKEGLSPEALSLFFEAAKKERDPVRTVLLLLPRTGLRISELCELDASAIQKRGELVCLSFRGKGDKPRTVPLGERGEADLRAWIEKRGRSEGPLFPGRGGSIKPGTVRDACRRIRARHEELTGLTPHILRHTYATRMVTAGVDIARLKALLGHTDISVTQKYLHPRVDDLGDAVKSVEGL